MLNAVLNAMLEHHELAELCFETAINYDHENVIGWTLYGRIDKRARHLFVQLTYVFSDLSKTCWQ
jgi:hypothetical protein